MLLLLLNTYRYVLLLLLLFDPIRLRFDSISIGQGFGTNSTYFRISFDSILFQFDSIRLCTSCEVIINIIPNPNNVMDVNEIESHPAQRCDSIRSDSIKIRFYFNWMPVWYQFYQNGNHLRFDSISIRFDSIVHLL
jgi:hypothetical protein